MQFPIVNILIVPTKNDFMNGIGAFVTVYTQIPTSNLKDHRYNREKDLTIKFSQNVNRTQR